MDFTKFHCPVCNDTFTENDDVVVCPECGTPHHRECYRNIGNCFNEKLHGTDTSIVENYKNPEDKKEKSPRLNEEISDGRNAENPFKINEKGLPDFIKFSAVQDHLIDGKHSSLFEAAVGKNQNYYIPKFTFMSSYNKKISINFIAFLAPLAWTLYRKMYKFSALIFAAYFFIFGLGFAFSYTNGELINSMNDILTEMQEQPEIYENFDLYNIIYSEEHYEELSVAQKSLADALKNMSVADYCILFAYVIFSSVLLYGPKIALGLFGNRLYLKKLRKNIDDAERKDMDGDKLKSYLFKKYGTLPLIVVATIGFFEFWLFYLR